MKRLDITNKAVTLLTSLSVVYALLEMDIIFLTPLITVAIAYKFMKYKEDEKYNENKKILNNLFLFNIISFIGVSSIGNGISQTIFDTVINIFISFLYYRVMISMEKKQENIYKNPEAIYEKINKKIDILETLSIKLEEEIENAKTEKSKDNLKTKIDAINQKIVQNKSQLEIIKIKIDSKKDKLN